MAKYFTKHMTYVISFTSVFLICAQGRNEGGQGGTIPRAPDHYGGAKSLRTASKSPNLVTSTFFNTVNLLPRDHRFEHGSAKLAFCPGRHLTPLHT